MLRIDCRKSQKLNHIRLHIHRMCFTENINTVLSVATTTQYVHTYISVATTTQYAHTHISVATTTQYVHTYISEATTTQYVHTHISVATTTQYVHTSVWLQPHSMYIHQWEYNHTVRTYIHQCGHNHTVRTYVHQCGHNHTVCTYIHTSVWLQKHNQRQWKQWYTYRLGIQPWSGESMSRCLVLLICGWGAERASCHSTYTAQTGRGYLSIYKQKQEVSNRRGQWYTLWEHATKQKRFYILCNSNT